MSPRRLRAPAEDGALLAEPPLSEGPRVLESNRQHLGGWDHDFQGRRAGRLRSLTRAQVLNEARRFLEGYGLEVPDSTSGPPQTLIVTGHQPEPYHPGVWVKNFAAEALARRSGGVGLNLIVDNDVPKHAAVRVPFLDGGDLKARYVEFDAWAGDSPFEDLQVRDERAFASFAERVNGLMGGLVPDPLLNDDWPRAVALGDRTPLLWPRLALMRRAREQDWGVRNLELPLSLVCQTEGFLWFASHLLAHLPRFRVIHNEALRRYRAVYGIRSHHHPVPDLAEKADWLEAPFWAWRQERPRRRPLLARQVGPSLQLRIEGESDPLLELPLGPDRDACCAVDRLRELPRRGVRLRTRALTTTLFARLLLGDLFLHGIGGAKYDELGDEIIRGFFGIEPPSYLTLSMTLWLGLPDDPEATPDQLRAVEHQLRDREFNPDRHLPEPISAEARNLVEAKHQALAGPIETRQQRIDRFEAIRRCNEALRPLVSADHARLQTRKDRLLKGLRWNRLARNREFACLLQSQSRLRKTMTRITGLDSW
ncbi:hypothetical protein BH23PLA1_BH23PLA1_06740 [soil metagenome]